MAPRSDRTTRIPSGVASPVSTNYVTNGSVFVNLRNAVTKEMGPESHTRCPALTPVTLIRVPRLGFGVYNVVTFRVVPTANSNRRLDSADSW